MIKLLFFALLLWLLLPMVLVAIGLPFAQRRSNLPVTFSQYKNPEPYKYDIDLPDWLRWLQNVEDGLMGDDRGWFWNVYKPALVPDSWWANPTFKMWWWSAIRNPWNYLKRFVIGIDVRHFTFHKLIGDDYVRDDLNNQGFQILVAMPKNGWLPRPMLYWVKELHNGRGICFQFGWKIKLSHGKLVERDEWDYWKGITLEPNPFKNLR